MTTTTEDQDLHDGEETVTLGGNDAPGAAEDRGDVVTPAPAPAAAQLAPAADADADSDTEAAAQHIPKARFDAVYAQRKEYQRRAEEAEAEIERLRTGTSPAPARAAQAAAVPEVDEDALEAAYADALLDGDTRKAAGIRREINAHIRASAAAEARSLGQAEAALAELDRASTQALQAHPWLDTDAGAEALDMIIAVRDQKIARGMPAHRALADAVAAIAPRFAPADDAAPGKGSTVPVAHADTRTSRSLIRGAAAAESQPPAVQAGLGNRTTASRVDVENLTEEQFDALTPAEKAKLRGD